MHQAEYDMPLVQHPIIPGWRLSLLHITDFLEHPADIAGRVTIAREDTRPVSDGVYTAIQRATPQLVVAIDLRNITLMPSMLWRQLGPILHTQVVDGVLGPEKRVVYLAGGDEEILRNLQWAFRDAAVEIFNQTGKRVDRAAIVPTAPKGYCGTLRAPYEEVFLQVRAHDSLTNEEVVSLVGHRYTFNNANNYLTALAGLGLVYRTVAARDSGGYVARAYAVGAEEEVIDHAFAVA